MNNIVTVYFAYIWVALLHALFVGVTLYTFLGNWLRKQQKWVPLIIIFSILAFFELYWIPLFSKLQISIFIGDKSVQQFFEIDDKTNIVQVIKPNLISFLLWIISTYLAYKIGNYIFTKNNKSDTYE